jgi:calcineurin-like phosphoesterase family protein
MDGLFFTADTHFGHAAVIGISRRRRPDGTPLGSVAAMDEMLVAAWNATVGARDTVWHLGDFARARTEEEATRAQALLRRLNGRIHLVLGNHDALIGLPGFGWAEVAAAAELRVPGGPRLLLSHLAPRSVPEDALALHGHSHGRGADGSRRIDVGVDAAARWAGAMRPVALEEIRDRAAMLGGGAGE